VTYVRRCLIEFTNKPPQATTDDASRIHFSQAPHWLFRYNWHIAHGASVQCQLSADSAQALRLHR
jgi:hypothetical protein